MMEQIKDGYKKTEVGVIPESWRIASFGDAFNIYVGSDLKEDAFSNFKDEAYKYPVYSNTVSDFGFYGYYNFPQYNGMSLTIVGRGVGLGTAFARKGGYGAIGRLLVLFPKGDVDPQFASEYINSYSDFFSESSGIPQLTGIQLAKYKIPLPPSLEEQKAIATALSDVDALIQSLDKLIAKKKAIKQGTMQRLLKSPAEGGQRLPGFSGEWEVKRLGEVLKVRHGRSQHEVLDPDGGVPILATGGQIGWANKFLYDKPSVLIGRKGTIDKPKYMERPFWSVDTLFFTEIPEGNLPKFLYYLFLMIDWYAYNEASGVPSLNARTIENIEYAFPPTLEEQKAIAQILSDMDKEIENLEQKREKYKSIKQGMMQELLTGKKRLV